MKRGALNSTNQLIEIKEEVIRNFEEARELLFGTTELEQVQEELEDTLNQLADEINALINEKSRELMNEKAEKKTSILGAIKDYQKNDKVNDSAKKENKEQER